ncbi:hypothetical protein ES708_28871 [subsurface metagenome]
MRDEILLVLAGVTGVVIMAVACMYFTGEDGTILAAASGTIGTIIGLVLGRTSVSTVPPVPP